MVQSADLAVIANPISGWGKGKRFARQLIRQLQGNFAHRLFWTEGRGHAQRLARQVVDQGFGTVVVVGGDGTLHEVVQALAHSQTALLPAPAGRCNDFAKAVGPLASPESLVRSLREPRAKKLDLARVGEQFFNTVGATGFDAKVSEFVDQTRLPVRGFLAYLTGIITVLAKYQPHQYHIRWDHGEYRGPLLMASIGNTPTYGNEIPITPLAKPDDGLLDLCLVEPVGFCRAMTLLNTVKKGRHAKLPMVSFHTSTWVEIEAEPIAPMWADGEPLSQTPVRVEVAPAALKVLEPPAG